MVTSFTQQFLFCLFVVIGLCVACVQVYVSMHIKAQHVRYTRTTTKRVPDHEMLNETNHPECEQLNNNMHFFFSLKYNLQSNQKWYRQ